MLSKILARPGVVGKPLSRRRSGRKRMSTLWALFNIGPAELIVLAACLGLPALGGIIALVIVLSQRKPNEPEDD
jgi:hypothetical protein